MDPLVLFPNDPEDADFVYACRMPVEEGLYIRFAPGDDILVVSSLELERAKSSAQAARIVDREEVGFVEMVDRRAAWAQVAAGLLRQRGETRVRISPRLQVAYFEALRAAGLEVEVDRELFVAERRRKSSEEASFIHAAQRAAEAACAEVISHLAVAEIADGLLWDDGRPLTSERLFARANAALNEIGYTTAEMIVAGSPGCAVPHYRGEGQLRANAPIIIDIFPRGMTSRYHGDLTRTVVVGEASEQVRRMHEACLAALEWAAGQIKAGADGRAVHRGACQVLVDQGFGTFTRGLEGNLEGPRMNHSLGHGVGLGVHEPPSLRDLDYPLQAGDVVTIEPGLYLQGLGGVRVEDTGLVTAEGFRNFTTLPRSLDPRAYL